MRRLLGLALLLAARPAAADPCDPSSGNSSCINANSLWLHASPTPFTGVAPARVGDHRGMVLALGTSFFSRPITANVPSSDPDGREVRILDHVVDGTIVGAYTLRRRWVLAFELPFASYQTGAGVEGLTEQDAPPVPRSAARDPRLGTTYTVLTDPLRVAGHLTVSFPFGDEESLAGEAGLALQPAISAEVGLGDRVVLGGEVGIRLREEVTLAGTRHGHQGRGAVGVSVVAVPRWLTATVEAWALPSLSSSKSTSFGGTTRTTTQIPAEWFLSVSSQIQPDFQLTLGGGGGIPLSTEKVDSPSAGRSNERFLGLTTPRFRALLLARFLTDSAGD